MGMDVYGLKPKNPKGEYFRNNVWWWHPLWDYCCQTCPEITLRVTNGHDNSGDGLGSVSSRKLGLRIQELIKNGSAEKYITEYYDHLNALPDEPCFCVKESIFQIFSEKESIFQIFSEEILLPKSLGNKDPNPECKTCKGLGVQPNWNKSYHISLENIQNFAEFLVNCGGFQIC